MSWKWKLIGWKGFVLTVVLWGRIRCRSCSCQFITPLWHGVLFLRYNMKVWNLDWSWNPLISLATLSIWWLVNYSFEVSSWHYLRHRQMRVAITHHCGKKCVSVWSLDASRKWIWYMMWMKCDIHVLLRNT